MPLGRDSLRLAIHVPPGARINARLRAALEGDRNTLRFDGAADSLGEYFAAPPTLTVSRQTLAAGAVVVAGICDAGAAVCHVTRTTVPAQP